MPSRESRRQAVSGLFLAAIKYILQDTGENQGLFCCDLGST